MGRDDGLQEKRRAGVLGLRRTPGGAEVRGSYPWICGDPKKLPVSVRSCDPS